MPILLLAVFAGVVLMARRSQTDALALKADGSSGALVKTGAATGIGAAAGGGEGALIGAAVGVGGTLGKVADTALLGGDSTKLTQDVAFAAGAIIGGASVLLAFGQIGWIAFAVVVVIVSIAYLVTAIVNDLEALSYGQAGALRDFNKHWDSCYAQCLARVRTLPDWNGVPDLVIERDLTPFVDGYMKALNFLAWKTWMSDAKGALTELGLDTMGHAQHGQARGHFLGEISPKHDDYGLLIFDDKKYLRSFRPEWIAKVCPPQTPQATVVTAALDQHTKGGQCSNVVQYVSWMSSNPKPGADHDRIVEGLKAGHFEGTEAPFSQAYPSPGTLSYLGQCFDWRELRNIGLGKPAVVATPAQTQAARAVALAAQAQHPVAVISKGKTPVPLHPFGQGNIR